MTDKPVNATAEAMKKALAAKRAGKGPVVSTGGPKPARHGEKAAFRANDALNKPAFRKASKRG